MAFMESRAAIAAEAQRLRAGGNRIVFTNGCFDLLHPGHIDLLTRARRLGDILIVGVNSDNSVRRLKGEDRPIFPEEERAEILRALEAVSYVCIFDEDTPLETILAIRPDVLVKGADWALDDVVGRKEVEGWGGEVVVLPLIEGQSTTNIIGRVTGRVTGGAGWKS